MTEMAKKNTVPRCAILDYVAFSNAGVAFIHFNMLSSYLCVFHFSIADMGCV